MRFDLNLLSALDALISEKNVTRAAERLNVTQPTMSGMLQRLRHQMGDPILIRNGRRMVLTPFALSMREPIGDLVRAVDRIVRAELSFNHATSGREFNVMVSDYGASTFLPQVVSDISANAPGIRINVHATAAPIAQMVSGRFDLCIGSDDLSRFDLPAGSDRIRTEHLLSDSFVCVVSDDHPLTETADLHELLSFPVVGVRTAGASQTVETEAIRRVVPLYRPSFMVTEFALVAPMVASSRLVGIVQARIAQEAARTMAIRSFEPPFAMPRFSEKMFWHSRYLDDPGHAWLRSVLRDAARARSVHEWQGRHDPLPRRSAAGRMG